MKFGQNGLLKGRRPSVSRFQLDRDTKPIRFSVAERAGFRSLFFGVAFVTKLSLEHEYIRCPRLNPKIIKPLRLDRISETSIGRMPPKPT